MDEKGIIDSIEELAKRFGKTPRTVYRWKDAGMPTRTDGSFDLFEVTAWRKRKKGAEIPSGAVQEGKIGSGSVQDSTTGSSAYPREVAPAGDKDLWDARNKQYQAEMRQLDLRKRRGELIEVKENEIRNIAKILEVKSFLLSFERLLPPELIRCRTDREMSEVIRKFTRTALQKFASFFPEAATITRPGDDATDGK